MPRKRKPRTPPSTPQHPQTDAMPPYTPGGVPEPLDAPPAQREEVERKAPPSGFPPKRAP